jgi:hypothetical protein
MANSLWAAIDAEAEIDRPRNVGGSGMVFSVGPKT